MKSKLLEAARWQTYEHGRNHAALHLGQIVLQVRRPYLGCVTEMAPDDRKVQCRTRLGDLDVPRRSVHKPEEFVGFRTLFSYLFVRGEIA